jgi:hypothetical protein
MFGRIHFLKLGKRCARHTDYGLAGGIGDQMEVKTLHDIFMDSGDNPTLWSTPPKLSSFAYVASR